MLSLDTNDYISKIYSKSLELHSLKEEGYNNRGGNDEEDEGNEDERYERMEYKCQNEAKQYNKSVYSDLKTQKANDVYLFEENPQKNSKVLTHQEKYIHYPRRELLREAIKKIQKYQEETNAIDYHPNVNDIDGELKTLVDEELKKNKKTNWRRRESDSEGKGASNHSDIVKVRNIIHQSLQPFYKGQAKSAKQDQIEKYFASQAGGLDQWGKETKISPSQFLWLPAEFIYSEEKKLYEVQGKLFNPLENCPDFPQLKDELNYLLTYFSDALKETHDHFKSLHYNLMNEYSDFDNGESIKDVKSKVDFSKRIHAIVKVTEMEIQPHSIYSGQWHVEGFSSDNILYTCLYVIEQDENLVNGKLIFKRTPRSDDVPGDPYEQEQCAHSYCPSYDYLCDPHKVIPLGSLDIKENLMIIFPNQNIHKVKGISNDTDKPLKRKIIAFFVVNHVDQPFTLNDVEFTQPLEVIKQNRLRDMYERSKNKQTDAQAFNYCEH